MKTMCCKPLAAKLISLDCLEQKGIFYLPPSISAIFQVTKKNACQDSWINKQHETNKKALKKCVTIESRQLFPEHKEAGSKAV